MNVLIMAEKQPCTITERETLTKTTQNSERKYKNVKFFLLEKELMI